MYLFQLQIIFLWVMYSQHVLHWLWSTFRLGFFG